MISPSISSETHAPAPPRRELKYPSYDAYTDLSPKPFPGRKENAEIFTVEVLSTPANAGLCMTCMPDTDPYQVSCPLRVNGQMSNAARRVLYLSFMVVFQNYQRCRAVIILSPAASIREQR